MSETVLLAAGEGSVAAAVEAVLAAAGQRIRIAHRRAEVDAALQDTRVVLIDTGFQDGGFALLEAIRQAPATAGVPVAMLIGRIGSADCDKARALGADAMLVKPFTAAALTQTVRRLADKAGAQRTGGGDA